jgi:hypothetical protein
MKSERNGNGSGSVVLLVVNADGVLESGQRSHAQFHCLLETTLHRTSGTDANTQHMQAQGRTGANVAPVRQRSS